MVNLVNICSRNAAYAAWYAGDACTRADRVWM